MNEKALDLSNLSLYEFVVESSQINGNNRLDLIQQVDGLIEGQQCSLEYNGYYYMKGGVCAASVEQYRKRIDEPMAI